MTIGDKFIQKTWDVDSGKLVEQEAKVLAVVNEWVVGQVRDFQPFIIMKDQAERELVK